MKLPLQVAFLESPESDTVEADIRAHAAKLESLCDRIMSCRVTVNRPAGYGHQGKRYAVHIDLKVPGEEIASTHGHESEDVHVAVRDAFDAVRRRLQDYVRRHRAHTTPRQPLVRVRGRVVRLLERGQGFIEDAYGNHYYFDSAEIDAAGCVKLEVGSPVEFLGEVAALGRQAKRVIPA